MSAGNDAATCCNKVMLIGRASLLSSTSTSPATTLSWRCTCLSSAEISGPLSIHTPNKKALASQCATEVAAEPPWAVVVQLKLVEPLRRAAR
eukprot:CAMPEP_0115319266 /NCGR_PEP_ID=MMETSP0270-20121206/79665_1 /TAXON_ID=71861 /ORGANISM="Scrippsiella trochoidea, Strain CCMP3099" /LENGTH=91 /DNA_ID=CAMNT_0002738929 /DNA_START=218 /DNA_END=493 /DNA_ORIENTATION=-